LKERTRHEPRSEKLSRGQVGEREIRARVCPADLTSHSGEKELQTRDETIAQRRQGRRVGGDWNERTAGLGGGFAHLALEAAIAGHRTVKRMYHTQENYRNRYVLIPVGAGLSQP